VALDLPPAARARLGGAIADLKPALPAVRFVRPEQLHVTLRFLGRTRTDQVEALAAEFGGACGRIAAFDCALGGISFFPSPRRARVLWIAVPLPPPVLDLQRRCEEIAVGAGFEAEARAFRPHLTLGRIHGRGHFAADEMPPLDVGRVRFDRVVLLASELRRGGAVHELLHSWPLATV
jgi:2'-5' RNA ligase